MAVPQLPQFTVYPLVWNPDTLAYEPQVNASGGGVASDVTVSNFPADGATGAKQTTGNASLASIDGKITAVNTGAVVVASGNVSVTNANLDAALSTLLTTSDFDTKTGGTTETAPVSDTASSGLNGRLQRIAQRLTTAITALGSPFQAGGSIGNTSFASPVADGANVVEGAVADAVVAAGAAGTLSAKLRAISRDLVANIVLAAGSAIIGKVGIDQTTPGTTNKVAIGTDGVVALGAGSAVIGHVVVDTAPTTAVTGPLTDTQLRASAVPVSLATAPTTAVTNANLDAPLSTLLTTNDFDTKTGAVTETAPTTDIASSGLNGRLQRIAQRVSSLITALGSPFQAGGSIGNTSFASPVADGANVVEGAVADAVVVAGAAGTISAKLRAISRDLVANIVLAAGSAIIGKVGIDQTTPGTTNAVAQQGTWTVQPGNTANTTAWKVDGSAVTQPVSAASLPLPSNAAQESSGNLASMVVLLTSLQTLVDQNAQILATLQAMRLQQAAAFGVDAFALDSVTEGFLN